jgi:4-hydroxy-2-oxoheptanedioate aldolase
MKPNKLRALLNDDRPTIGTRIYSSWPTLIEMVGGTGHFDYVEFVSEYSPFDLYDLDNLSRAAEVAGISMMIKVEQEPRGYLGGRALGSGFESILFSDCRDAAEARETVKLARPDTPEDDGRFGAVARRFTAGAYGGDLSYAQAVRDVVVALMIEKGGTVDELDEVLAIPGLDMIQWGPSDYGMNTGKAGTPGVNEARDYVYKTALATDVIPRAEINTADDAKRWLDIGVRHFCMAAEVGILQQWWRANGDSMRKALEGQ